MDRAAALTSEVPHGFELLDVSGLNPNMACEEDEPGKVVAGNSAAIFASALERMLAGEVEQQLERPSGVANNAAAAEAQLPSVAFVCCIVAHGTWTATQHMEDGQQHSVFLTVNIDVFFLNWLTVGTCRSSCSVWLEVEEEVYWHDSSG